MPHLSTFRTVSKRKTSWRDEKKDLVRKAMLSCIRRSWEGTWERERATWVGTLPAEGGGRLLWEWAGREALEAAENKRNLKEKEKSVQQVRWGWCLHPLQHFSRDASERGIARHLFILRRVVASLKFWCSSHNSLNAIPYSDQWGSQV